MSRNAGNTTKWRLDCDTCDGWHIIPLVDVWIEPSTDSDGFHHAINGRHGRCKLVPAPVNGSVRLQLMAMGVTDTDVLSEYAGQLLDTTPDLAGFLGETAQDKPLWVAWFGAEPGEDAA